METIKQNQNAPAIQTMSTRSQDKNVSENFIFSQAAKISNHTTEIINSLIEPTPSVTINAHNKNIASQQSTSNLNKIFNIVSYNIYGFKANNNYLKQLVLFNEIVFICEHWLAQEEEYNLYECITEDQQILFKSSFSLAEKNFFNK